MASPSRKKKGEKKSPKKAPNPPMTPTPPPKEEVLPSFPPQRSGMDPLAAYQRLKAEESRLRRLLNSVLEVAYSRDAHDLGEAESDHGDIPLDTAAEVLEKERAYLMEEQIEEALDRIQDALDKLQEGTYGICDHCGRFIGERRLHAIPYAILCVECQSQFE